jgi:electron transport complex protein RnfE
MPDFFEPIAIFIKAPGAFLVLAIIVMIMNALSITTRANKITEGCDGCCASCNKTCEEEGKEE